MQPDLSHYLMSLTIIASASIFAILMLSFSRGATVSSKLLSLIHRLTTDSASIASMAATNYSTSVAKILPPTNVPDVAHDKPHHVIKSGRVVGYKNPHASYDPPHPWEHVAKPMLKRELKFPNTKNVDIDIVTPKFNTNRFSLAPNDALNATWLGHACYYVEFPSGLRVLFDPVFDTSCSPLFAKPFGPKRYTPTPCDITDLPEVDAVVISHSHYDHLSLWSLLDLRKKHPNAQYFVGMGLASWFRNRGFKNVTEMDWWQDTDLTVNVPDEKGDVVPITARISCLPSQHNSARGIFDRDQTLWASWGIKSGSKNVWFGGDTGYRSVTSLPKDTPDDWATEHAKLPRNPQFKDIGTLRGPFDLGLIPIGAYAPRAAFSGMHANPRDAVEIFLDTRCKRAMGIHWGTWALTVEEPLEPPRLLKESLRGYGIEEEGVFDVCKIGESKVFDTEEGVEWRERVGDWPRGAL